MGILEGCGGTPAPTNVDEILKDEFDVIRADLRNIAASDEAGKSSIALDTYQELKMAGDLLNRYAEYFHKSRYQFVAGYFYQALKICDYSLLSYEDNKEVLPIVIAKNPHHVFSLFDFYKYEEVVFTETGNEGVFLPFSTENEKSPIVGIPFYNTEFKAIIEPLTSDSITTPQQEREVLIEVIQAYDKALVKKVEGLTGNSCHDDGGWPGDETAPLAKIFGTTFLCQQDCVAEAANTQAFLFFISPSYLRFHEVYPDDFSIRKEPAYATFHLASAIVEKGTNERYTVDTWPSAMGEPCLILAEEEWKTQVSASDPFVPAHAQLMSLLEFYTEFFDETGQRDMTQQSGTFYTHKPIHLDFDGNRILDQKDTDEFLLRIKTLLRDMNIEMTLELPASGQAATDPLSAIEAGKVHLAEDLATWMMDSGLKNLLKIQFDAYETVDHGDESLRSTVSI